MKLDNIKLIAFDLDGTLLNSVPDLTTAVDAAVRALGYDSVTEHDVSLWVGNGVEVLLRRAISRDIVVDPSIDDDMLNRARAVFNDTYAHCGHTLSQLYPTVKESLHTLYHSGYKLAVVTNKPSEFVPEILEKQSIADYFSDVIGGEDFPKRKPDPMALNWLLDKYGLSREELLMVGDSKNDILAAKNAQCLSFGLTYGYNHGEPISHAEPDIVADQMSELVTLLGLAE